MGNMVWSYFKSDTSIIRQNFADGSEAMLNQLANMLLIGSYACQSVSCYFDRVENGFYGLANFARFAGSAVGSIAVTVMDYIVLRGGKVTFTNINSPGTENWGRPIEFFDSITNKITYLNEFLVKIHSNALSNNDAHLCDFLETELIRPFAAMMKILAELTDNLKIAGEGLGEYQFNKDLQVNLMQYLDNMQIPALNLDFQNQEIESD